MKTGVNKGGNMKKIITGIIAVFVVITGCAAPQEKKLIEEYMDFSRTVLFTPEKMLSKDYEVKAKALLDYTALEPDSKKVVDTYLAYMLADEEDASIRHEILDLLRDVKAGPFVVAPLIRAYGGAHYAAVRTEISQFIKEYKPSNLELPGLIKLLEEKDWDTRIKAIRVMATMKSKAGPAFPEILDVMRETGPSYGLYAECFDNAEQIDAGAAFSAAELDLISPSHEIKESALRKIYEVYTAEQIPEKKRKDALRAMERVMYGADAELSLLSKKMMEESGRKDARLKLEEFEAYKNMKVASMKELADIKMKSKFAEEEDNIYLTLKLYYLKNNREDAVKSIFDPLKGRQKQ
jgi:HEAT repeat protein